MITRRKLLQIAALQGLGVFNLSAHALETFNWSPGLASLKPIANPFFGDLPLTLSNKTKITFDTGEFIEDGKAVHVTPGSHQVPVTITNIHSPKLILAIQGYRDLATHKVAVFNFSESFGDKLQTRINLNAFYDWREYPRLYRVWAITKDGNKILCSYDDIYHLVSGY